MREMTPVSSHEFSKSEGLMLRITTIRDDIGQAFVELALVLPIFILLLVGVAEVGRLAYASIEVSNAARAGVAYGSQNHTTASDTANIRLAAIQDAPNLTTLTAIATQVCSCSDGTAITCANAGTTCLKPAHIIEYVKVTTSAPVNTAFHFPGIASSITFRGFAIMRVEQ
jgi:Flp pilus assembly protein TadG